MMPNEMCLSLKRMRVRKPTGELELDFFPNAQLLTSRMRRRMTTTATTRFGHFHSQSGSVAHSASHPTGTSMLAAVCLVFMR
jgi:hypothetical protein